MVKKDKVLSGVIIIINCVVNYIIAENSWINRMPSATPVNTNFMKNFYEVFIGRGCPTILTALITTIALYIMDKVILKKQVGKMKYVLIFCILFIINVIIHVVCIDVVV